MWLKPDFPYFPRNSEYVHDVSTLFAKLESYVINRKTGALLTFTRVSCKTAADKAAYLNVWTSPSEYNQVVISWTTEFTLGERDNSLWAEFFPVPSIENANVQGWRLEWEIGYADNNGNFGKWTSV